MVNAICKTTTSISASSLTTIAGFLALCAMQLTLGRDIGVVMAKGVALGVVCTIVILPALILFFDKWVEKYRHRTLIPKLTRLSYFVSGHPVGGADRVHCHYHSLCTGSGQDFCLLRPV